MQWYKEEINEAKLPGRTVMNFVGKVRDITGGVATILKLKEHDSIESNFEDSKILLGKNHHGSLERLSIATLELLNSESDNMTNWAYECYTEKGKKEKGIK